MLNQASIASFFTPFDGSQPEYPQLLRLGLILWYILTPPLIKPQFVLKHPLYLCIRIVQQALRKSVSQLIPIAVFLSALLSHCNLL
jgi:hypothetical protein